MEKDRQQLGHVVPVHDLLGLLLQPAKELSVILDPFIAFETRINLDYTNAISLH
jgi:hypothetical protein